MLLEDGSVVLGPGHREHDASDSAVTQLELSTPLQSLDVVQSRLGVDRHVGGSIEERVPGAEVTVASHQNLGAPSELAADHCPEALQESQLARVPNRRRFWIHP